MNSKQYFDEVADQWDSMRESFFSTNIREKAMDAANMQPGKLAADIGAGTGFITEGLLQKGLKVVAIDQSQEMLETMRNKFAEFSGVDYRIGKAASLPMEDGSVDYAFANMYLHHVESPLQGITEMVRILKKDGKLIITDLDEHNFEFLKNEQHDRWMGFKRDDVKQWFLEAGLKNVDVDCVGENCCAKSSCGSENASISIFVATGTKPLISTMKGVLDGQR
jgi:ubiquinone/menaquinone biosynthesis C-methylase UbiE